MVASKQAKMNPTQAQGSKQTIKHVHEAAHIPHAMSQTAPSNELTKHTSSHGSKQVSEKNIQAGTTSQRDDR
jgi:hypothetical protein